MVITNKNIFQASDILHRRISIIQQRVNKLKHKMTDNALSEAENQEMLELNRKLAPLSRRLTEIHQQILDYSVRIKSDNERFIVVEYYVNHTSCAEIANQEYFDRSGVYKIIRKYREM